MFRQEFDSPISHQIMKKIIQIATVNVGFVGLVALTEDGKTYQLRGKSTKSDEFYWAPLPNIPDDDYEEMREFEELGA